MPVRLLVTFTTQPGRSDDFLNAWQERLAEVHQEPGCEQYEFFRSVARPDELLLVERWTDAETLKAHAELNQQRTPIARDLLAGPTRMERFDV